MTAFYFAFTRFKLKGAKILHDLTRGAKNLHDLTRFEFCHLTLFKQQFFRQQLYLIMAKILIIWQKYNNTIPSGKNDGKILSDELTDNEKRILLELINNPSIPYDTLVVELGISRRTVSRVFVSLVEKGFIERIGTNKKEYWKIIK